MTENSPNISGPRALQSPANSAVNPVALSIEEVSRLLSAAGERRVTVEQVQADIDAGAPVVPRSGGTRINLVHYAAWLIREVQAK